MVIAVHFGMNAQLYYFVESGTNVSSNTKVMMVYVSGIKCYSTSKKASEISSKLYSDSSYWEDWMSERLSKADEPFEYDSSLSTSSYEVYSSPWRGEGQWVSDFSWEKTKGSRIGDYYRGISSDGKTCIVWKQRKNSNEVLNKTYYESIDPDILNQDPHDFLR